MISPYRVLIVDDAPAVCEALRWVVNDTPELMVVGEAQDGETAVSQAKALNPDIIILDIELPRLDGYSVAHLLKKTMSSPPLILFLSVHDDHISRQRAKTAGGDGFVDKGAGWPVLLSSIRSLIAE